MTDDKSTLPEVIILNWTLAGPSLVHVAEGVQLHEHHLVGVAGQAVRLWLGVAPAMAEAMDACDVEARRLQGAILAKGAASCEVFTMGAELARELYRMDLAAEMTAPSSAETGAPS